ncbi:MAG: FadR family transcriptional regulator, partial [Solirubrobacterales bacterium]|nr:FadR family transcriptional regulator [Solirubrobacterales bacterium]
MNEVQLERRAIVAPVRRVRKAYEQVYDQLRELIMRGELERGQRLPNEALLAREFGVSRGTVREALRLLAAHGLIRTAKGAGGGSFITLPTVDHVSEFLQVNIGLLNESRDVSAEEMLEARELLESFAARMA